MQKKIHCFTAFLLFILMPSICLRAQIIENSINLYGNNYPQEKIHIHFDKESYLPGETIWFKAYLFEENLPTERSTNFYAALYDESGKLVQQQISPVFKGSSDGHFAIPDSINATQLICRAYTSWMLNFDTSMLFTRAIKIIGDKANVDSETVNRPVSLQFFPEGGDLITGAVNTIAFKSNYDNGLPFNVDAVIKKQETGEVIMPLTALHDGMGKFDLDIQKGDKYYAEWLDSKGTKQQTWLPDAKTTGVSLKLSLQKDKMFFNLVNRTNSDSLHILMYMYQKVFYRSNIAVTNTEPFTGMVPLKALPAGTMQLTVFDANWQPVAERIAFIYNNDVIINAAVNTKEISMQKRGKNSLEIFVADTIPANLSLSISDAEVNTETAENTIVTDFLLKGDVRGYIHNPAFYFTNMADADLKNKLDLVMLTNGWRRYNWADMLVQKMPAVNFQPDDYLGIYGQIGDDAMRKMEKDEQVTLIVKTVDSTNNFYTVKPEQNGFIRQNGLVFYDSAKVYFTFNKTKLLNKRMAFSKSNFTLQQPVAIDNYKNYLLSGTVPQLLTQNTSLFNYYKANGGIRLFNDEKMMQGVVVKTNSLNNWRNSPLVKLDEKYASGPFAGSTSGSFAFDVLHDETAASSLDIYDYIGYKVPGLRVAFSGGLGGGKSFEHRNGAPAIYVNDGKFDNDYLQTLAVSQIAYIKFFERLVTEAPKENAGAGASGFTPVLVIYLKKGDDLIDRTPKETDLNMATVAGYTPVKEFYSPNYAEKNAGSGTDARATLLWMPYILTDKNKQKIPITFYNNDFTKKMRLVLEGINDDGKMIRIEKIIE